MLLRILILFIFSSSLIGEDSFWYKPKFMQHSVSYLYGNTFKVGERDRETMSFDHFSVWEWGEIYAFLDYMHFDEDDDEAYFEIKPKISLSYLFDIKMELGPVKDVFWSNEFNYSNLGGAEVYLTGLGVKMDVPGFKWWNMNLYFREDVKVNGRGTYQFSTDWCIPINISDKIKLHIEGFADFAGTSGNSKHNILFSPQVLLDVGNIFGKPGSLYAGTEYIYWQNKFGIEGVDEEVWQFIVKYSF